MFHNLPTLSQLLIGVFCALLISLASFRAGFLTWSGAAAQFFLGCALLGIGGWQWTVPILVFFITASLLSKYADARRTPAQTPEGKGSTRDGMQVLANGGAGGLLVLAWMAVPDEKLYLSYLGAIAAAAADTWGTEIGTLAGRHPRLITSFRPVPAGTSGAVTFAGLAGSVAGAGLVALSADPWLSRMARQAVLPALAGGIAGSLADSLLGASVQARFCCVTCGKATEQPMHCGLPARKTAGFRWLTNDAVNLLATVTGATIAALLA